LKQGIAYLKTYHYNSIPGVQRKKYEIKMLAVFFIPILHAREIHYLQKVFISGQEV